MNRNTRVALFLVVAFVAMVGLAFATVPLYRAFCSATGFNGTARRARGELADMKPTDDIIRVHFDSNTHGISWTFKPEKPYMDTRVGRTALMNFTVRNNSDRPVTGRAAYNVLPDTMGAYFMKLQCFCFTDQTLQPGESRTFPVVFFLDPKLLKDPDTRDVPDVTLSYTFFEVKKGANSAG